MYPILFSFGPLFISSFGFLLALGLLSAIFVIWRLVRVYDLDEEKILDLILLTFFGGLLGSRVMFVILNWEVFGDLTRIVLINRYPGLSFWGGLIGGILTFWLFVRRTKFNRWQLADLGVVGLAIGLVFGNLGCFLGGCGYGKVSNSMIATQIVGLVGKRFPISGIEALVYILVFIILWRQAVRFHFFGKLVSEFLIFLGIIKFITEFYRGDNRPILNLQNVYIGSLFSLGLVISGIWVFYKRSKRKFAYDITFIGRIFTSSKVRKQLIYFLKKELL